MTISRLKTLKNKPQPIKLVELLDNPYRFKPYRRMIDMASFTVYGHWVKKGEQQNRAALFEVEPKCDLKALHVKSTGLTVLSRLSFVFKCSVCSVLIQLYIYLYLGYIPHFIFSLLVDFVYLY